MVRGDDAERPLDDDERQRLRAVLIRHGVALATVFGSTTREGNDPGDLDLAIEFDADRPGDDGYASAYLDLYSTLEDEFPIEVDLVDFHSMSPGFARAVFDDAVVILGDVDRLDALADRYGATASVTDARERITAVAARLGEEST